MRDTVKAEADTGEFSQDLSELCCLFTKQSNRWCSLKQKTPAGPDASVCCKHTQTLTKGQIFIHRGGLEAHPKERPVSLHLTPYFFVSSEGETADEVDCSSNNSQRMHR